MEQLREPDRMKSLRAAAARLAHFCAKSHDVMIL
jgi:hypothetical protein